MNLYKGKDVDMKKIALFSLMACVSIMGNVAFAGALDKVKFHKGYPPSLSADEYWQIIDGKDPQFLECDDDEGDVGDHFVVFRYMGSPVFRSRECLLTTTNDYWGGQKDVEWCSGSKTVYCKDLPDGYKICSENNGIRALSPYYNVYGAYKHLCKQCQKGYGRVKENYTFTNQCNGKCSITKDACVPEGILDCYNAIKRGEPANWNGTSCNCGSVDGIVYSWDSKTKKCEKGDKKSDKKDSNKGDKTRPVKNNSCETRHKGNVQAIACCNLGKEWDDTNNTCKCGDNEEWKNENSEWKCVVKQNVVVDPNDNELSNCEYTFNMAVNCSNGNEFKKGKKVQLTKGQLRDLFGGSCDTFKLQGTQVDNLLKETKQEIKDYQEIIKLVCGDGASAISPVFVNTTPTVDPTAAKETLKDFFKNAQEDASVWKTESGNFNGARLASDLTAGVVLGTVGGVVSANVIKKNQLKKGYEVLHCTIGGQTVADWGDTFNTGLRR